MLGGVTTTTSQGYNAIDELTSLNGSSTGLADDADGNQTKNPGNTAVGVAPVTATTVNGRDQITAATVAGANTTNSYLGETQTTRLTANNGSTTTTFSSTMLGLIGQATSTASTSYTRTPDGQLVTATTSGTSQYYLTDNLGSTVGTISSTGVKTAAYAYDPYGRPRVATGTNAAANTIRYASGTYDPSAGTTKYGARYYDPNTGRFTQPDPSGQESNPFAYAADNPISRSDPDGLCSEYDGECGGDDYDTSSGTGCQVENSECMDPGEYYGPSADESEGCRGGIASVIAGLMAPEADPVILLLAGFGAYTGLAEC